MTETEVAIALGDALIRYLSAKRTTEKLNQKVQASAIIAICDNEPQKYDDEEVKRITAEMKAAHSSLMALTQEYIKVRPQSVPPRVDVPLDADQASTLETIGQVSSWGMHL